MRYRMIAIQAVAVCLLWASLILGDERILEPGSYLETRAIAFELGAGKGEFHAWGRGKDSCVFFGEFLPALFERTIVLDEFGPGSEIQWIFTGDRGSTR